jgi:sulfate transport system substrate-binding protein
VIHSRFTRVILSVGVLIALGVSVFSVNAWTPASDTTDLKIPEITLTLAGFAVPREAYAELIPAFQAKWLTEKNQRVVFKESYIASGAQSRAIVGGFEADIATLSIERDMTRIQDANLITYDWKAPPYQGMVTQSVVVLVVHKGNPAGIKDWSDLTKPGIEVITPDPATSGGAQWNLLAAYGAALRGQVPGVAQGDQTAALDFLGKIIKNVLVYDKDGRESIITFEKGIGTVAITYESEAHIGLAAGADYEIIYPASTIRIENPTAVIDVYTKKHGTLEVAQSFVDFTYSTEGQLIWAKKGFRPVNKTALADKAHQEWFKSKFPAIKDEFTVAELGGWNAIARDLFGETGKITHLIATVKAR